MERYGAPGFQVKPLPWFLSIPNAFTKNLGISAPRLTPENITKVAARAAGLPTNFPSHVEEALEILCRSYRDEAHLHWFGRKNVWYLLVTGLSSLLRIEKKFKDDPDLQRATIKPFLVVTGLPRSGTTYLHRLLSAPMDAFGVPLYLHIHPLQKSRLDLRKLDVLANFEPWRLAGKIYGMDSMHRIRPLLPDECIFGMRLALRSMIYWATAPTYGYLRWLLAQDLSETYQLYRKIIILYQRQMPGKHIALKCPHHMAFLTTLITALPEARIVQTHRNPKQAIASEAKLILSSHALSTKRLDWRNTVEHNFLKVSTYAKRSVEFAKSVQGKQVFHVKYDRLLSEPLQVVQDIGLHFDIPLGQNSIIETFIKHNQQHKYGKNRYSLEQFGIDERRIEKTFQPYLDQFLANSD